MQCMDSKSLETLAAHKVSDYLTLSKHLDPYVNTNDKEPCWDGNVEIYNDKSKGKKDMIGRIAIQVKGRQRNIHPNAQITYPVSVVDLQRYLSDGIIYFVVYISEDGIKQTIYYSAMPPIVVRNWLQLANERKNRKGITQKTISISFSPLPQDISKIDDIFIHCYEESCRQRSFAQSSLPTIADLQQSNNFEGLTTFISTFSDSPADSIVGTEIYSYARISGSPIPIPLGDILYVNGVHKTETSHVHIGTQEFDIWVDYYHSTTQTICIFENCIKCIFHGPNTTTHQMQVQLPSSIRSAVNCYPFLLAVLKNGGFDFIKSGRKIAVRGISANQDTLSHKERQYEIFKNITEVFDTLSYYGDLDLSHLTESDKRNLLRLVDAFIYKKPVCGLKKDIPCVSAMAISDLRFALYFASMPDDPSTYQLSDFFSIDLNCVVNIDGSMQPMSQYFILTAKDYESLSNLKPLTVINSYRKLASKPYICEYATRSLLDMLLAYDHTNDKRSDLLDCASDMAEFILEISKTQEQIDIAKVNQIQVIRRKRALVIDEQLTLYEIITRYSHNSLIGICCDLLLGMQAQALDNIKHLSPKERHEFATFPINRFLSSSTL